MRTALRAHTLVASASAVLLLATVAPSAGAQEAASPPTLRLPIAYVDRPLTRPRLVLAPDIDASFAQTPDAALNATTITTAAGPVVAYQEGPVTDSTWGLSPGVAIGATDDLEAHARVPIVLARSRVDLTAPSFGVTYRFVRGPVVEVGVRSDLLVYAQGDSGIGQTAALPVRLHLGHALRVDTGPTLTFASRANITLGLSVPLAVAVQLVDVVSVGAATGLQMRLATDAQYVADASTTLTFPLGFFANLTLPGPLGPRLDVRPYVTWSAFATPNAQPAGSVYAPGTGVLTTPPPETLHTDAYRVGVVATGYFYL